jgi:predicted HTH domain antitoxin
MPIQEGLRAILTDKVIEQYRRGGMTLREAAARLGLDIWEFQDLLRQRGVPISAEEGQRPDAQLLREKAEELIE